jgi:hypothetical protein
MFYSRTMSRWDPIPTSGQRWLVGHRTKVRIGALLLIVMSICLIVYDLVTVGFDKGDAGPTSAIAFSLLVLLTTRDAARLVDKYDSAGHHGRNSG